MINRDSEPLEGNLLKRNTGTLANNSGEGPNTPVLDIIAKKFNWGAFWFNWIWGLFNKTFLPLIVLLICLIPVVGIFIVFGLCIWFGIKGNEWAWQNKRWKSIEHFHSVQKKWAIASGIFFFLTVAPVLATLILPSLMVDTGAQEKKIAIKKACYLLVETAQLNATTGNKCEGTSEGLASCVAENLEATQNGNILTTEDATWEFHGDGTCSDKTSCRVDVTFNKFKTTISIPIHLEEGDMFPNPEDVLKQFKK